MVETLSDVHSIPRPIHMVELVQVVCTPNSDHAQLHANDTFSAGYSVREELPLPSKPPYIAHLGNLSFDATVADVTDFFADCECKSVRIIEDKEQMKPKGFGYAEFNTLDGLKKALTLSQSPFQGRNIRISIADPRTLLRTHHFTKQQTNTFLNSKAK